MATQFENGLTLSELAERNAELVTEVENYVPNATRH